MSVCLFAPYFIRFPPSYFIKLLSTKSVYRRASVQIMKFHSNDLVVVQGFFFFFFFSLSNRINRSRAPCYCCCTGQIFFDRSKQHRDDQFEIQPRFSADWFNLFPQPKEEKMSKQEAKQKDRPPFFFSTFPPDCRPENAPQNNMACFTSPGYY